MRRLRSVLLLPELGLIALSARGRVVDCLVVADAVRTQVAQQGQPASGQLTPASAAPETSTQPNLRTDSKPRTDASPATDSGPPPESTSQGGQVPPDLGLDFSTLPDDQRGFTEIFSSKGVTRIPEEPVAPLPVTNPPEPASTILANLPMPRVVMMPAPPDPSPKPHSPQAEASASPQ